MSPSNKVRGETRIHPTAIVSKEAEIGAGAEIGAYAIVDGPVRVGDGSKIHAHAQVLNRVVLGEDCEIFANAVIGGVPQDRKFAGEDTGLEIGDRCLIRENATLHLGTYQGSGVTKIGNDNLIMACSHVAHDCLIGNGVTMSNNVLLAGHVHVDDGVTISGATVVHQFTSIGRLAMIGGLARVAMDVPPFLIVEGRPGIVRGLNIVGLRRRGVSDASVERLKELYRSLFRSKENTETVMADWESRSDLPEEAQQLLAFMRRAEQGQKGRYLESLRRGGEVADPESLSEARRSPEDSR